MRTTTKAVIAGLLTAAGVTISTPALAFDPTVPAVDEVHPAAPGMFTPGGFPALRDVPNLYLHQFNAEEPESNPSVNKHTVGLDSVINYFTVEHPDRPASAQFGVQGLRTVQFLSVTTEGGDVAWAQGESNLDGVSVETYGAQDEETKQEVSQLIYELEVVKGAPFNLKTHDEVMATMCGDDVDLADYRARVDALHNPPPPPPPAVNPHFYVRAG